MQTINCRDEATHSSFATEIFLFSFNKIVLRIPVDHKGLKEKLSIFMVENMTNFFKDQHLVQIQAICLHQIIRNFHSSSTKIFWNTSRPKEK